MSSATAERMTSRTRTRLTIEIVVLSLVLPLGVLEWFAATALKDKQVWGRPSDILKLHHTGSARDGELWFAEAQLDGNSNAMAKESRIKRLDLQTGVERDTGLVVAGDFAHPKWLSDKLYLVSSNAIYEVRGDSLVQIAASLPSMGPSYSLVFLYEDRLTTIRERETGRRYLTHLIDGQWVDGREIVIPGPNLAWHEDQERGRTVLLPRTSLPPQGAVARNCLLWVVQHGTQHHLMLTNYQQGFAAYRAGFQFADEEQDVASAVAPENVPPEAFGWIPIGEPLDADKSPLGAWMQMVSTSHGPVFVFWGYKRQVFRPASDGRWEELIGLGDSVWGGQLLPDTSNSTIYAAYSDDNWGSLRVRRIGTDAGQAETLVVPGCESEYVGRWRTLAWGVLFAWLLHIAVLIAGAEWLTRRGCSEKHEFGVEQASLAPVWRRAVATTVDVTLMLIVLSLLWLLCCWVFGFKHVPFHGAMLFDSLLRIEGSLAGGLRFFKYIPETLLGSPIGWLVHPFAVGRDFPSLWVAALCVAGGLKVLFEGRVGVTPAL